MSWSQCCGSVIAISAAYQWHIMVQCCCDSGSTNKLSCVSYFHQKQRSDFKDPIGSCLFAAGLPTDTVGSQDFQPFSTRQTPHLGD